VEQVTAINVTEEEQKGALLLVVVTGKFLVLHVEEVVVLGNMITMPRRMYGKGVMGV
jgi:hypothetical protein